MKYLLTILGILGLDQGLKNRIEQTGMEGRTEKRYGRFLLIKKHHNQGAFLNMGQGRPRIVAVLSLLMTIALTLFFIMTLGVAGKGFLKWGLTLLLGGAYSNTYDRLVRKYVVDYVSFNVPCRLRKVIFNIGDFGIMVGAMLCVIDSQRK